MSAGTTSDATGTWVSMAAVFPMGKWRMTLLLSGGGLDPPNGVSWRRRGCLMSVGSLGTKPWPFLAWRCLATPQTRKFSRLPPISGAYGI